MHTGMVASASPAGQTLEPRLPINLVGEDFQRNKYAHYAWMRENAPVCDARISIMRLKVLTRYDDCVALMKDPRFVRDRSKATRGGRFPFPLPKSIALLAESMITSDDPEHRRLRGLVNQAFKPAAVARLADSIETLTQQLLDEAAREGTVDLMQTYALPIPTTVIQRMLGVEEADMPRFRDAMRSATQGFSGLRMMRTLLWDMPAAVRFMRDVVAGKRLDPRDDMLSDLLRAEEEGDRLNEDEVISMCFLLIVAGYETTSHLISNAVLTLLQHPEQLERLRADPGLMPTAVEEVLRFRGPVHASKPCYPVEDLSWNGAPLRRGSMVLPIFGAANHDPSAFEQPEVFDVAREPNHHLGFGHGVHFCLGAQLARLETQIALRNLLERFPNLRLAVPEEKLRLQPMPGWHRYESLPVRLA